MSETKNLRLFKHNEPLETNENKFDIDLALNQNWDKIEEFAGMVNDKVIELEDKDEEQDFNLQELQNEIKKDRENMINLETEGQSIHIEDSSDLEGQLEVLGNVEQDLREGYNLYDYMSRVIATTKGLNVTKDTENGYLIVNGTPETDYTSITAGTNITDKIKDKTTYSLWQEKYDGKLFLQVNAKKKDASGYDYFSVTSAKKDFTVDKSKYGDYTMVIQTGLKTQAGTFNNYKNRYMLYEGTEEKPYEPYGASPSLEYPSEIRVVGDNINLLENTAKTQTVNGVTFTVNADGSIIANGIAEAEASLTINNQINLGKGEYCISGCPKGGGNNTYRIGLWNNTWESIALDLGDSSNFTLQQNTEAIKCAINIKQGTTVKDVVFKPKIEKGTVATSYSKFGQGSVEIQKTTANYYDVRNYNGTKPSYVTVDKNDWITIIGNNTEDSVIYLNYFTNNLDLIVGKKYWIVAEIKSVSGEGNFNITSISNGSGQFKGRAMQLTDLKIGQKVIFQETAINSAGQGLRTFISLPAGKSCNITFRISVLETDPNKTNWEYVPYKKETYILPIQKPMLEGDYLDKINKKEVHKFGYVNTKGMTDVKVLKSEILEENNFFRYIVTIPGITNKKLGTSLKIFCTHFVYGNSRWSKEEAICGWETGQQFCIGTFNKKYDTAEKLKTFLIENIVEIYYELAEPNKLNLTTEQTEILERLDNLQTYKPVTNITTDSIAKLKLKYIADTKTYIDNKTSNLEQQVSVINQLLSTTKTSSVLLDNLQTDIESEVL